MGCCSRPSCGGAAGGRGGVLVCTPRQQLGGLPVPPPHLHRGQRSRGREGTSPAPPPNPISSLPLGVGVLPAAGGVLGDTLGRAAGAREQPEGTGVALVLAWGWRLGAGQGTVPPLALGWPGERGGCWGVAKEPPRSWCPLPVSSLPAVPPRGGSDLPRAPAPCPWGGHGREGPTRLGGSPLPPEGPLAAAGE